MIFFKNERKTTHIVDWAARERERFSWLSFSEQILSNKFPKDRVPFEVPLKPNYAAAKLLYPNRTQEAARSRFRKSKTTIRTNLNVQSDFRRVSWFHKYKLRIHKF